MLVFYSCQRFHKIKQKIERRIDKRCKNRVQFQGNKGTTEILIKSNIENYSESYRDIDCVKKNRSITFNGGTFDAIVHNAHAKIILILLNCTCDFPLLPQKSTQKWLQEKNQNK